MIRSLLSALALVLAGNVTVASAQQYLGPEEVLFQNVNNVPTTRRAAQQRAAEQEAARAARFYSSAPAAGADPTADTNGAHGAADEFDPIPGGGVVIEGTSRETLDGLGSVANQNRNSGDGSALHAGAGLPGTGPAAMLAGLALAMACGWTLLRARKMSR